MLRMRVFVCPLLRVKESIDFRDAMSTISIFSRVESST